MATLLSALFQAPVVKICGIREPAHAATAAQAGADLVGMIFAPSRRQISPEQARDIAHAAKTTGVLTVGVFVNAAAEEINRVVRVVGLDLVQLHGDESPELLSLLDAPAIKVLRPTPGTSSDDVLRALAPYVVGAVAPVAVLLEGYSAAGHGGVGARADWNLADEIVRTIGVPTMLAGGLTPENVAEAIASVRPAGVDTSSGVERDGVKDPARIVAFVQNARVAFGAVTQPGAAR